MGDGSEAFDFIAVEDCALANICAMKADTVDEQYNVGTGIRTSLKELAEMIVHITGCNKEINYTDRSSATLVKNRIGDPKKASDDLNFNAKIRLEEGLKKLIDWRTNNIAEIKKFNL